MLTDRTGDVLEAEERSDYDYADRRDYEPFKRHVDKLRAIIDRLSARLASAEMVANAARDLRTVQRQRDRDEYEHCAAGATYGLDVLLQAEKNLDDAIAGLEALK